MICDVFEEDSFVISLLNLVLKVDNNVIFWDLCVLISMYVFVHVAVPAHMCGYVCACVWMDKRVVVVVVVVVVCVCVCVCVWNKCKAMQV